MDDLAAHLWELPGQMRMRSMLAQACMTCTKYVNVIVEVVLSWPPFLTQSNGFGSIASWSSFAS